MGGVQMLGFIFGVLWIHSLVGSIGGGSYEVGLEWGTGNCGGLT